ncbi:MAG: hypothetical protein IKK37_03570 [Clostridia bacterium]|nr:hypothetical protein [Clostridia bacterium]
MKIRNKKTISGKMLEVDYYPIFDDGRRVPTRAPKTKPSTEAQEKYNRAKAKKKIVRLVNANFDNTDFFVHPTYEDFQAPQTEEQARKDIVNYLRRIKTKRKSELKKVSAELSELEEVCKESESKFLAVRLDKLRHKVSKLAEPFKYIYVMERQEYKSGARKGQLNWHFHLFMSGGLDAETVEAMWPYRINCNRYQPEKFGFEAAAKYIAKDPCGSKSFAYSKNLTQPTVLEPKDGRVTKRYVERIARERVDDKDFWEKKFKGYRFVKLVKKFNEFNLNWYVSVIMVKAGTGEPLVNPGAYDDWLDDVC